MENFLLLSLTKNITLTERIGKILNQPTHVFKVSHFKDGETLVKPPVSVRGKNVFIIQSTSAPVSESYMELFIALDACKRASALSLSVITPYFGYGRQDRKCNSREPITSKLMMNLLTTAGMTRFMTIDIHARQIMGFLEVPSDDLFFVHEFALAIAQNVKANHQEDEVAIVSPDFGGVARARLLAEVLNPLNTNVALIDKRRHSPNQSEVLNILGNVENKVCFLVDDMIDTGGTICNAAQALIKKGKAKAVYLFATHAVLSGDAVININHAIDEGYVSKVYFSDSIANERIAELKSFEIISSDHLIAHYLKRVVSGVGLSSIYNKIKAKIEEVLS